MKSDFLNILQSRGFIHQTTDMEALDARMQKGPIKAYIGFDCTGPSLHVGSLIQIMMLRWLQKTGNNPIVLLGGGTSRVGDPSGKDESRQMLTDEIIADNMVGIKKIFEQFITFSDEGTGATVVNNGDWLDTLNYVDLLRDVGPHFTINRMMTFDSVKLRLEREQPLTFLEFNYMILQAYDFMNLSQRDDCCLQMGGSDQWGNIINGIELTRRMTQKQVFGLTTPLITTADGAKMGKTANGAIWLNEEQLSSYDYWQFWRNTQDGDVVKFLKLFTELPLDEIDRLATLEGQEINEAKKVLADKATKMCRGNEAAAAANETATKTFEEGKTGTDLPTYNLDITNGINVIDAFLESGLGKSKGEIRRSIKQGALRVNDEKITAEDQIISANDLKGDSVKISSGKKRHALIKQS